MTRRITMFAAVVFIMVSASGAQAYEDWGVHCIQMLPYADVLTVDLIQPNYPVPHLMAQAEWNGLTVYSLPGGGAFYGDLDERVYTFDMTLANSSTFFGGHPNIKVHGSLWGGWSMEGRGKPGVVPYVVHGTNRIAPCDDPAVAQSSELLFAQRGLKALAGAQ